MRHGKSPRSAAREARFRFPGNSHRYATHVMSPFAAPTFLAPSPSILLIRLSSRRHWNAPSRRHPLEYCGALKPSRLGQIDAKSVAFPLVAPRHFGAGVTEALLNVGFFDLGGTGKTGAQGIPCRVNVFDETRF